MHSRKYALITGATGAIGNSIARLIAENGDYHVTIIGRNEKRTGRAVANLIHLSGNDNIDYRICDLSRKSEIITLAKGWDTPLHVLVNDAAVTPRQREETQEGIEMQWATNVLGYHWMMKYFAPILAKHAPSRIVNVASYWAGGLDLGDPEFKNRHYNNDTAYRQSKQADRMLSLAFARNLANENITVNACHPGDVRSTLASNLGYGGHETPDQGAATPAWLATSPVVEGASGKYYEHMHESECSFSHDHEGVEELFRICESY
jgi:NAD(P)-dependent dehydrogenase (short-subunit alcohol dehydrogenase family)